MQSAAHLLEALEDIDAELAGTQYGPDRDRLLDQRLEYQHGLDLLWRGMLARS